MRQAAALGLACALVGGLAHTQTFTVDHLLSLQDLTKAAFSPGGRYLVMDVEAPWDQAGRYDLDANTYLALGRPMIIEAPLAAGTVTAAIARPLLPMEDGAGYTTGDFSPDGARIVVYRLRGSRLELGVTTLASGETIWPGVEVDTEVFAPVARWIDETSLLVLERSADNARAFAGGWAHQTHSTRAWAAQASGQASGTVLGSGRYRVLNPPSPPTRLLVVDIGTGAARSMATGAFVDMTLSPDRQHVALVLDGDRLPATLEPPSLAKGTDRRRLMIADLRTGKTIVPCPACDMARLSPAWSPDSQAVLAAARLDGGSAAFSYWRLAVDGTHRPLAPDLTLLDSAGRDPRPIGGAAWLSGDAVVLARRGAETRQDWWRLSLRGPVKLTGALISPGPALSVGREGVLLMEPDGPVCVKPDGAIERLAEASARLAFKARLKGDPARQVVATTGGVSRPIWPDRGDSWPNATPMKDRVLDIAPEHGLTASLSRSASGVKAVTIRDRAGVARTALILNPQMAAVRTAAAIAVPHQGADGQTRTSWLYMPPGTTSDDIPVVVTPYPGSAYPTPPTAAEPGELAFSANVQLITGAGYAALVPSLPIADDAEPGAGLAAAILSALDAARVQQPRLSKIRAALWGQSFGGWGVLMAATQTDRFRAVIATSPITNLVSFYGVLSPQALAAPERYFPLPSMYGWSETGQGRMLAPPWRAPDRYARNSPALLSHKITAPVMLVTSDSDFTTGQAAPMFSALFRQDKDAVLLNYRGEGHLVLNPENLRDLYTRAFSFLRDTMGSPAVTRAEATRPSQ